MFACLCCFRAGAGAKGAHQTDQCAEGEKGGANIVQGRGESVVVGHACSHHEKRMANVLRLHVFLQKEKKQLKVLKKERTRRKTRTASASQVTNDTMVERFVASDDEASDREVLASNRLFFC